MKMKAHIAAIAIIMLLGIAIAGFLFMVKEKSEARSNEIIRENFEKEIGIELEDSIKKACDLDKYELIIDSPVRVEISGTGDSICIDSTCKQLELPENCTIKEFNYTLYKEKYVLRLNKENDEIRAEVKFWQ